jgi:hypothetical protein
VLKSLRAGGRRNILCAWTFDLPFGRVASSLVSEHRNIYSLSIARKNKFHHATEKKG